MRVLHVASEVYPLIKTGGLADVAAALPAALTRIGVDASNPPFAVATADDLFGLEIDLGHALAEEIGVPVRFINMGYDGLYDSIRADQVDMVISTLTMDPLRTNDVRYTQPYFDAGFPHGYDQWMSAAGTSWSAMALTLALPEAGPVKVARLR